MGFQEHIVMVPFMAHGHLIPFLALANQIHQTTGFTITIANTPLNIKYLHSTISKTYPDSKIRLAELSFNSTDHDLPPNTENTENLKLSDVNKLFHASLSLEDPLRLLISHIIKEEGKPPLCLISDVFLGWVVNVSNTFGTKAFSFNTCSAYGTTAYASIWLNLPHRSTTSDEFPVPGFPENYRFHRTQLHKFIREANGSDPWSRFFRPQISLSMRSSGWLCYTVEELEPLGLKLLRDYIKLPVWSVGPLLPLTQLNNSESKALRNNRGGKEPTVAPEECVRWLDTHDPRSVLFISFGSQNTITATQMMVLAKGLEESRKPFIWVIRPPLGFDLKGEFRSEWLPEGFEKRVTESKMGLLVRNWAPQLVILSHKSTGAFLSHCGWNSVMESLSQGVPIIGWPLAAEQAYNSKMLVEEMGVGVELTRTVETVISEEQVKEVIEIVMDKEGKGGEMRRKAAELAEHIRKGVREVGEEKGSCLRAMNDFIRTLLSSRGH